MKIIYNNKNNIYNIGGKIIYQNQNNPDYYYEDPRSKIDQLNVIPQLVSSEVLIIV